jgi:transcriptional regulator with XRE-family HTH domain
MPVQTRPKDQVQDAMHGRRVQLTARRVHMRRRDLGLTQQELAARCGFPHQIISRVEQGHQDLYVRRLIALAHALDVTTDYLLGLSEQERYGC